MATVRMLGLWPSDQIHKHSCWTKQHPEADKLPIVFTLREAMAAFWRVRIWEFTTNWHGRLFSQQECRHAQPRPDGEDGYVPFIPGVETDLTKATEMMRQVAGQIRDGVYIPRLSGFELMFGDTGTDATDYMDWLDPIYPILRFTSAIFTDDPIRPLTSLAYRMCNYIHGNIRSGPTPDELDPEVGSVEFRFMDKITTIPVYGFQPDEPPDDLFAGYEGTVSGMSESITLQASNGGESGNSIRLVFDGSITIDQAVAAWNAGHPSDSISLVGNGGQTPDNGQVIQLSGGISGDVICKGFIRPYTWWEYDPNDGGGPIYDKWTGKQLRGFPSY